MAGMILDPGKTDLAGLEAIYRDPNLVISLSHRTRDNIEAAARTIAAAAAADTPVYGVNTGFGKLASVKIPPGDTATLQRNLILSHCCGVGEPAKTQYGSQRQVSFRAENNSRRTFRLVAYTGVPR